MNQASQSINIKGRLIDLKAPLVMGVLNITPDSFFDGGKNNFISEAIQSVEKMITEGVDIVDIGAVSSRPGANVVSIEEEEARLYPVLKEVRNKFPLVPISIDTYRSKVVQRTLDLGANIINDITAGDGDPKMFETIIKANVPYIIMHMKGQPSNMQNNPQYENVVKEIVLYFEQKVKQLKAKGVSDIILDPGFGFGKTVEHNYQLLKSLSFFKQLGLPLIIGVSRKSMINKVLEITPKDALNGSTVLHTLALLNGASILRVHDVKEAKEAIKLVSLYKEMDY